MSNHNIVSWLEDWYHSQCNGRWEHEYGVLIETLDNPGWSVVIDLTGTPKESAQESEIKIERSKTNWIHCFIRKKRFEAFGGTKNLTELLYIFKRWITNKENMGLEVLGQEKT